MNNNLTTERALLGTFAPTSYISFGEKVRPGTRHNQSSNNFFRTHQLCLADLV